MASHFHKLKVKEVRQETLNCVSVCFNVPEDLKELFAFEHGQNITLKTTIGNEEVRRSYSICSSSIENELRVAIKKAAYGKFSVYANEQLKAGEELEVLPPTGKFNTKLHAGNKKNYLAFAAGSGITPVISIIKTILFTEPLSSCTLVYGNKNRQSIIFFEELQALKNKYMNRFTLINVLSREKYDIPVSYGRIDTKKLDELTAFIPYNNFDDVFICGPQEMLFTIKNYLEENGMDKKKIHFELFTSGSIKKDYRIAGETLQTSGTGNCAITIISDGRSFNFNMPSNSQSILDAALQQNIDLPFACKGGMCCSCKAKLKDGKVKMDVHWGLEDEEIEKGYILACQSHPLTQSLTVDFDIK